MAQSGGEISSLHLAVAAGGGMLLYAALRGVSPLQALRDVTSGAPPAVSTSGKVVTNSAGVVDDVPDAGGTGHWKGAYRQAKVPAALRRPSAFIAALNVHAGETYSQGSRWASGHSDCSSFAGKGLLDTGIAPPGGSITSDYLASADWLTVSAPRMGDVAVNSHHMAVFTDGSHGIGQQNSRRNVQRDVMDNLMANTGSWTIKRYRGWA